MIEILLICVACVLVFGPILVALSIRAHRLRTHRTAPSLIAEGELEDGTRFVFEID